MQARFLFGLAIAVMVLTKASFAELVVDANLGDWGITVADNNASSLALAPGFELLGAHIEDQDDLAGIGAPLGPNLGGQRYDAELLAVAHQSGQLFVALVTGQRPDNELKWFAPGDLLIETSAGRFGIEIGGGPGGADGSLLTAGLPGSTYLLQSNGETVEHFWADDLQTTGSIWSNAEWILDPIAPAVPTQMSITPTSVQVGMADYVYTRDSSTTQHSIIELALDVSVFGGATIQEIAWRPSCGNDELQVPLSFVPEPSSLTLMAGGALLVTCRARKA